MKIKEKIKKINWKKVGDVAIVVSTILACGSTVVLTGMMIADRRRDDGDDGHDRIIVLESDPDDWGDEVVSLD